MGGSDIGRSRLDSAGCLWLDENSELNCFEHQLEHVYRAPRRSDHQMDREKAKELEQLRRSDAEKFKAELVKTMQSMRDRMMKQGRNREGRTRNAESGQSRQVRD